MRERQEKPGNDSSTNKVAFTTEQHSHWGYSIGLVPAEQVLALLGDKEALHPKGRTVPKGFEIGRLLWGALALVQSQLTRFRG